MNNQEIRRTIDELYTKINKELNPSIFVLNKKIQQYTAEIQSLQKECNHGFVKGKCVYCDLEEE